MSLFCILFLNSSGKEVNLCVMEPVSDEKNWMQVLMDGIFLRSATEIHKVSPEVQG